jgi:hypothetical protein
MLSLSNTCLCHVKGGTHKYEETLLYPSKHNQFKIVYYALTNNKYYIIIETVLQCVDY